MRSRVRAASWFLPSPQMTPPPQQEPYGPYEDPGLDPVPVALEVPETGSAGRSAATEGPTGRGVHLGAPPWDTGAQPSPFGLCSVTGTGTDPPSQGQDCKGANRWTKVEWGSGKEGAGCGEGLHSGWRGTGCGDTARMGRGQGRESWQCVAVSPELSLWVPGRPAEDTSPSGLCPAPPQASQR